MITDQKIEIYAAQNGLIIKYNKKYDDGVDVQEFHVLEQDESNEMGKIEEIH